jgi:hypothetical protein
MSGTAAHKLHTFNDIKFYKFSSFVASRRTLVYFLKKSAPVQEFLCFSLNFDCRFLSYPVCKLAFIQFIFVRIRIGAWWMLSITRHRDEAATCCTK